MSGNRPLSYPAPMPEKRHFNPLSHIPTVKARMFLFDAIFSHQIVRERIRPILLHGIVLTVIGGALTASGHSQMYVRSIAIFVCAICLALEVAVWISGTTWKRYYKAIAFCAAAYILEASAMRIMYWFLLSTLEDQRTDVSQNLYGTALLPPSGDVLKSLFTFRNNGKTAIGKHQISCVTNLIKFTNGGEIQRGEAKIIQPSQVPLLPGGDAQTDNCIESIVGGNYFIPECADITLSMLYVLETQPENPDHKEVRFVADKAHGFTWNQQPTKMPISPCKK